MPTAKAIVNAPTEAKRDGHLNKNLTPTLVK